MGKLPKVSQQETVRASTRSSLTPESRFSTLNTKELVPDSSCHSEEPPGKTPTPRELSGTGPTQRSKDSCLGWGAGSELVPLPAVSTRGLGAEGSIWPGGGAGQPGCVQHSTGGRGPGRGGGREDWGQRHFLQPFVHRPLEARRQRTRGNTGERVQREGRQRPRQRQSWRARWRLASRRSPSHLAFRRGRRQAGKWTP